MAIKLIGNYAKRLGLPGYSSHQFSVSVETELTDSGDIQREATRIYDLLQHAVDREIQQTGFVPSESYGLSENGSTNRNGTKPHNASGTTHSNGNGNSGNSGWSCSDKQKEFIGKIVAQNDLDLQSVEDIAFERFGVGVRQLNKTQASGLISELLDLCGNRSRASNGRK